MAAEWTTPSAIHSKCGESSPNFATLAIDDNTGTFWRHYVTCFHWIIFDMGETKKITKIRLYQHSVPPLQWGQSDGLTVYVGDNPANLGAAVWQGALNAAGWQESGAFDKNGRYVKLVCKNNEVQQLMYEFDAYAEAVAPPPPIIELFQEEGDDFMESKFGASF